MSSDSTWSQTAYPSLSFPTCQTRQLVESSPNTASNGNSTVSPCVLRRPIQENSNKHLTTQNYEDCSLLGLRVTVLHDDQSHHHTAGDVPGPAPQTLRGRPASTTTCDQNCWPSGRLLFLSFILTDENELHHTLHKTWKVLRNVDFRTTLNIILASLAVIPLNKHVLLKHFCHRDYITHES